MSLLAAMALAFTAAGCRQESTPAPATPAPAAAPSAGESPQNPPADPPTEPAAETPPPTVGGDRTPSKQAVDPAVRAGELLFIEARFAHAVMAKAGDGPLPGADIGEAATQRHAVAEGEPIPGAYPGHGMSCRHCHLLDEHAGLTGRVGGRALADFAARTPIEARRDGRTTTLRNTQQSLDLGATGGGPARPWIMLHHDGEFSSLAGLVRATFLGRNMGWMADEGPAALAHIARVVREGQLDGTDDRWIDVLTGRRPVPGSGVLAPADRLAESAEPEAILDHITGLVVRYVEAQQLARDASGTHIGSPYDRFLAANGLPTHPRAGERDEAYAKRLLARLDALKEPTFITDGGLGTHGDQPFRFGPTELHGLKTFLRDDPSAPVAGQCATCHVPPLFTDFGFHNVGVSQVEYENIHGNGRFFTLEIPTLAQRNAEPDRYLPPTAEAPDRVAPFFRVPEKAHKEWADLGVWNMLDNPALDAATRKRIVEAFARTHPDITDPEARAKAAVAAFRTPMLRNLGQSDPYMHHGGFNGLEDVVGHYRSIAQLTRMHAVRNPDPALRRIRIGDREVIALTAFLRSLNEDHPIVSAASRLP